MRPKGSYIFARCLQADASAANLDVATQAPPADAEALSPGVAVPSPDAAALSPDAVAPHLIQSRCCSLPHSVAIPLNAAELQAILDGASRDFERQRKHITSKPVVRDKVLDILIITAAIACIERNESDGRNLIQRGWDRNPVDEANIEFLAAALRERTEQEAPRAAAAQGTVIANAVAANEAA